MIKEMSLKQTDSLTEFGSSSAYDFRSFYGIGIFVEKIEKNVRKINSAFEI